MVGLVWFLYFSYCVYGHLWLKPEASVYMQVTKQISWIVGYTIYGTDIKDIVQIS